MAEPVRPVRHEPHPDTPRDTHNPIDVDPETCISCVICDYVCPGDIIYAPDPTSNDLPVIKYPDECWYCGLCQQACPTDAITVVFPDRMLASTTPPESLLGVLPPEYRSVADGEVGIAGAGDRG